MLYDVGYVIIFSYGRLFRRLVRWHALKLYVNRHTESCLVCHSSVDALACVVTTLRYHKQASYNTTLFFKFIYSTAPAKRVLDYYFCRLVMGVDRMCCETDHLLLLCMCAACKSDDNLFFQQFFKCKYVPFPWCHPVFLPPCLAGPN